MATLLLNPRRRRKAAKSRKHRTAAQRAATRRMIAANRARKGSSAPRRARRSRRRSVVLANPIRRARRSRRSYRRNPIGGRAFNRVRSSGAFNMLKQGGMLGVGAVAVDILYGQLLRFLPASMALPMNSDGSTNWMYFAGKAATAIGVATFGKKVIPARFAEMAGVGTLAIMAYQIARSMVPASLTLGAYVNPGRVVGGRMNGLRGPVGAYQQLPGAGSASPIRTGVRQPAFAR